MKQTTASLHAQQATAEGNREVLIYESTKQYSTIVAMNRRSGGLSFLVLSKENSGATIR